MIRDTVLHKSIHSLLNILFPPQCLGCRTLGVFLCEQCYTTIQWLPQAFCPTCQCSIDPKEPKCLCSKQDLSFVFAGGAFTGPLRQAIHELKYRNQRAGVVSLTTLVLSQCDRFLEPDHLVVPIPLHPQRLRNRGYNQAALIARSLVKQHPLVQYQNALKRQKATISQAGLDAAQRQHNMENAFVGDPLLCAQRTIALIDDVCTTGATLCAAARAAKIAGAASVYAIVLASAL